METIYIYIYRELGIEVDSDRPSASIECRSHRSAFPIFLNTGSSIVFRPPFNRQICYAAESLASTQSSPRYRTTRRRVTRSKERKRKKAIVFHRNRTTDIIVADYSFDRLETNWDTLEAGRGGSGRIVRGIPSRRFARLGMFDKTDNKGKDRSADGFSSNWAAV